MNMIDNIQELPDLLGKQNIDEYRQNIQRKYNFLKVTSLFDGLMAFGLDCNDGWIPLLTRLFEEIDKEVKRNKINDFRVIQVKEKFGQLRIYTIGGNKTINNLISEAEGLSGTICEVCGNTGTVDYNKHWYKCLCSEHK